ncbi:hypothetical protein PFZ55_47425 [Streptomyces sp. MS2A]|nr:hypothetical protein [Streptomyces sp. MS2A]
MTRPWPGNPDSAWAAVEEQAKTQRLSDRPASVPRMDDLGARLRRMSGLTNRVFGVALLIGSAVLASFAPSFVDTASSQLTSEHFAWTMIPVLALIPAGFAAMVWIGLFLLLYPRHAWGPAAWVAGHAMLCEAHPYRLRLRKHPSDAAVATILLGGGGIDGDHVRIGGEQAVRIVRACEQWATQLENDPAAYTEFWRRWRREDPEVLPTELLFGPEGVGGFVTCVDRHHRWFLVIPHRRMARPENPWHHAHALPVWWTTEHADSMGIDWGSMRRGS